jgi:hypothetical protein
MLTPEACWYQRLAGTRTLLAPEVRWHQDFAGLCWRQEFTDTRGLLTLEACWHQKLPTATAQLSSLTSLSSVAPLLRIALIPPLQQDTEVFGARSSLAMFFQHIWVVGSSLIAILANSICTNLPIPPTMNSQFSEISNSVDPSAIMSLWSRSSSE